MYDKNFQKVSTGRLELFSSFFTAIKSFISELVLEGSKELKNIEMGNYTVLITSISDIQADLVMIADKEDGKTLNKLIPKIIKILMKHQQIFLEWEGDRDVFMVLEEPLTELISSKKSLVEGKTLIENPEQFLQSMWSHKEEVPIDIQGSLVQERDMLIEKLNTSQNVSQKLALCEKLLEISGNLKDDKQFLTCQNQIKKFKDEIKDIKLKLDYYLKKVKTSLTEAVDLLGSKPIKSGDYKDAYLNLYSFSTKLKSITSMNKWEHYRDLAKSLINKDQISEHELYKAITGILKMRDDIESYLE